MKTNRSGAAAACIVCISVLIFSAFSASDIFLPLSGKSSDDECTAVIVTGTMSRSGRCMLAKNRDSSDSVNRMYYCGRGTVVWENVTYSTWAFSSENVYWMGMNERGLAVISTAMCGLEEPHVPGATLDNGGLNRKILELCDSISQLCTMLNATDSPIGPLNRARCSTCLGVIDMYNRGMFLEVSNSQAYGEEVTNGYESRANHPRIFPGKSSGPWGRDKYALEKMAQLSAANGGYLSWQDLTKVMRYVHDKEWGDTPFSLGTGFWAEVSNDFTCASIVAVSGTRKYNGAFNVFLAEFGVSPLVGLYVPVMPCAGGIDPRVAALHRLTDIFRLYATGGSAYYYPDRVRKILAMSSASETWAISRYSEMRDRYVTHNDVALSASEIKSIISDYINRTITYELQSYNMTRISGLPTPLSFSG